MRDGKDTTVTATLAEREDDRPRKAEADKPGLRRLAAARSASRCRSSRRSSARCSASRPASKACSSSASRRFRRRPTPQIQEGDIITQVNGEKVTTTDEFGKIVAKAGKGDYLRLYVYSPRADASRFALVKIED